MLDESILDDLDTPGGNGDPTLLDELFEQDKAVDKQSEDRLRHILSPLVSLQIENLQSDVANQIDGEITMQKSMCDCPCNNQQLLEVLSRDSDSALVNNQLNISAIPKAPQPRPLLPPTSATLEATPIVPNAQLAAPLQPLTMVSSVLQSNHQNHQPTKTSGTTNSVPRLLLSLLIPPAPTNMSSESQRSSP